MNGEVAQQAARRLSVDVANLSYRLALADAGRDALTSMVENIDPQFWQRRMIASTSSVPEVILTEEQAGAVEALIALIHDLL